MDAVDGQAIQGEPFVHGCGLPIIQHEGGAFDTVPQQPLRCVISRDLRATGVERGEGVQNKERPHRRLCILGTSQIAGRTRRADPQRQLAQFAPEFFQIRLGDGPEVIDSCRQRCRLVASHALQLGETGCAIRNCGDLSMGLHDLLTYDIERAGKRGMLTAEGGERIRQRRLTQDEFRQTGCPVVVQRLNTLERRDLGLCRACHGRRLTIQRLCNVAIDEILLLSKPTHGPNSGNPVPCLTKG